MSELKDLTEQIFELLLVVGRGRNNKNGSARWLCRCRCGKEVQVNSYDLRRGHTKSCGCVKREIISETHSTHKLSTHSLYFVWIPMMGRCYNEDNAGYKDYGGRGITVCDRWHDVANFIADVEAEIGLCPDKNHSFDRIENNDIYRPRNIRWATFTVQAANKRSWSNTGYKGVSYDKKRNKYLACVSRQGRVLLKKRFAAVEAAAQAVNEIYRQYYPECSVPNPQVV